MFWYVKELVFTYTLTAGKTTRMVNLRSSEKG